MFENIDDQLMVDIDPFEKDFDNRIIFKENDIENINIIFEPDSYINNLEEISLKDTIEMNNLLNEYYVMESLEDKKDLLREIKHMDKLIYSEEKEVVSIKQFFLFRLAKFLFKDVVGRSFKVIRKISMWVYRLARGAFRILWSFLKRGTTYTIGNPDKSRIGINIRMVMALVVGFVIIARRHSKMKQKQHYHNKLAEEKGTAESQVITLEADSDKKIKVIKHNDLIRVISSYENILRSCEKMLEEIAVFKYNGIDEMNKEIRPNDLSVLQLSLEGKNIKRERLRMERGTIVSLGYSTDIKKYEDMKKDVFQKYENFIRKEIMFVPKTHGGSNTNVRQVAGMVRFVDKIAFTSVTIADYHITRAINSLKYIR